MADLILINALYWLPSWDFCVAIAALLAMCKFYALSVSKRRNPATPLWEMILHTSLFPWYFTKCTFAVKKIFLLGYLEYYCLGSEKHPKADKQECGLLNCLLVSRFLLLSLTPTEVTIVSFPCYKLIFNGTITFKYGPEYEFWICLTAGWYSASLELVCCIMAALSLYRCRNKNVDNIMYFGEFLNDLTYNM